MGIKKLHALNDRLMTMGELLSRHPELRPTPAEQKAAKGSSKLSSALRHGECIPPRARSLGERSAHVLLWAAKSHPGEFVAHADLAVVLLGISNAIGTRRLVREVIAASMPGARRILQRKGHYVLGVRGIGFRCTVDKEDARTNYMPRVHRYVLSTIRSFLRRATIIDAADLSLATFEQVEQQVRETDRVLRGLRDWGVEVADEQARIDSIKARFAEVRRRRSGN